MDLTAARNVVTCLRRALQVLFDDYYEYRQRTRLPELGAGGSW